MNGKHPKRVCGKTPKQLARLVASLHYQALVRFYIELSACLNKDAFADYNRGRKKLANALMDASGKTIAVALPIREALEISEPFMKDEKGQGHHKGQ